MGTSRWQAVARAAGLIGGRGSPAGDAGTVRPTIFAEMTALAARTGAADLGQGFPDEDGPASVRGIAAQAIADGLNQYPPGPGIQPLREAIARHQQRHYGIDLDPGTEVLVTTGATEGLTAAVLALAQPGDEVLTLEPFYDSHAAAIAMAGARHRTVGLVPGPGGFRLDVPALEAAVGERTRLILLNSPHNPTGAVLSRAELGAIAEVAQRHDLIVVTDEVYEHLTYSGAAHIPIATLPGMFERTVTVSSAGKTFSLTGWKIGWASGPAHLMTAVLTVKQFLTYTSGAPFQPAIAAALDAETGDGPDSGWIAGLRDRLAQRGDLLCEGLTEAGFEVSRPSGTYFVIADAAHLLDEGTPDADALAWSLPERAGVVAVPVSAFTTPGSATDESLRTSLRFTFVKSKPVLMRAVEGLRALSQRGGARSARR